MQIKMGKNIITKGILILLFLLIQGVFLHAQQLQSVNNLCPFLSGDERQTLLAEGEISRFQITGFSSTWIPHSPLKSISAQAVSSKNMNMGIEVLFLDKSIDMNEFTANREQTLLKMYNKLGSMTSLKGLMYYSASRKKMRLLFEESYAIDSPEARNPIADPLFSVLPAYHSFSAYQKDKTFGANTYSVERYRSGDVLNLSLTNKSPMKYNGFIKVMDPENMRIELVIIPTKEGLLLYGMMGGKTMDAKIFQKKASKSFYNRVKALHSWFFAEQW